MSNLKNTQTPVVENELTLLEVYQIFSQYWNHHYRLWIKLSSTVSYNLILSINDFIHFCQIDKIINIQAFTGAKKTKYIKNIIEKGKLDFNRLEQALINANKHKHFRLKKQALIALANSLKHKTDIFDQICFDANELFVNVAPDFILINDLKPDRCLLLCNKIKQHQHQQYLPNLAHVKSLMYCYHNHARFHDFDQYRRYPIEFNRLMKSKGGE